MYAVRIVMCQFEYFTGESDAVWERNIGMVSSETPSSMGRSRQKFLEGSANRDFSFFSIKSFIIIYSSGTIFFKREKGKGP